MPLLIDYAARHLRLRHFLPQGMPLLSADDFEERSRLLIERSQKRPEFERLFRRSPCLPLCLPRMTIDDYGKALDALFAPSMGESFREAHGKMMFFNHEHRGQMAFQVAIAPESRHERLALRMKSGSVVALFFPKVFRRRRVDIYRKRMAKLPTDCFLGGGIDTMTALLMYPSVMVPNPKFDSPTFFMPALRWRDGAEELLVASHTNGLSVMTFADYAMLGNSFAGLLVMEESDH
jgi:hypothetical protein